MKFSTENWLFLPKMNIITLFLCNNTLFYENVFVDLMNEKLFEINEGNAEILSRTLLAFPRIATS